MSSRQKNSRGAHNNTYAFRHNPNSKKTEKILNSPNEGVCHGCWDMIEWRKKYRKYKPLTVLRRCDTCHMKTVRLAYHTMCQKCAEEKKMCAKCGKEPMTHPYQVLGADPKKDEEQLALSKMTERQRRTYLRELERERSGRGKKSTNEGEDISEPSDDEYDDDEDMPAPPPSKFDPDMLVKERAARAALQQGGYATASPAKAPKKSGDEDEESGEDCGDSDDDHLDGSAESYEDDSEEIENIDEDAKKLVGNKDRDLQENQENGEDLTEDEDDEADEEEKKSNASDKKDAEDDAGSEDEGDE